MNACLKQLEAYACQWPGISAGTHRFGGRIFRLGRSEIGHMHNDGVLEIFFPRPLRDELLAQGLAEKHRSAPDSGRVMFHVRGEIDVNHAVWLLRLSYLRFVLKAVPDPVKRFDAESEQLQLNSRLKALLRRFVPEDSHVAA
ncbi:MAG TPA: luciferase family protein [Candidatus Angelobacter sp.]|nr:luciferase family protein [Candidatus Angelobacter sp.]